MQHDLDTSTVSAATFDKLQTILKAEPSNALAHVLLGQSYDAIGMRDMAREQFAEAYRLDPERSTEVLRRFKEKYHSDSPATSFMEWVEIRQTFPLDDDVREMETVVALMFGTVSTAESAYIAERKHGHPLMGVATMISKRRSVQRRYAEALRLAQTDVSLHPADIEALIAKAAALNGSNQYQAAISTVNPVYLRAPYRPGIAYHLSLASHRAGLNEAALEPALFNLARSTSKRDQLEGVALLELILPHVSAERITASLDNASKKIDITGYRANYHHNLGLLFEKLGDSTRAGMELRSAVTVSASNSQWMMDLGRIDESEGKYKEALQCYLAAQTMSPGSDEIAMHLRRYEMRLVNRENDLAWRLKDALRGH